MRKDRKKEGHKKETKNKQGRPYFDYRHIITPGGLNPRMLRLDISYSSLLLQDCTKRWRRRMARNVTLYVALKLLLFRKPLLTTNTFISDKLGLLFYQLNRSLDDKPDKLLEDAIFFLIMKVQFC
jgi:hypothetical protein